MTITPNKAWRGIGLALTLAACTLASTAPASATQNASQSPLWAESVGDGVHIRASPDVDGQVVGTMNRGDRIVVLGDGVAGDNYGYPCGDAGYPSDYIWWPVDHFGQQRYVVSNCTTWVR